MKNNFTRLGDAIVDNQFAKKHSGKVVIAYAEDLYTRESIEGHANWIAELYARLGKTCLWSNLERVYVACEEDIIYTPTATAVLDENEKETISIGEDCEYCVLKSGYVSAYNGKLRSGRGGFASIILP